MMGWRSWFGKGSVVERDEQELNVSTELLPIGATSGLSDLFIEISASDIVSALDSWTWLPLSGLKAIAVSSFGEVFLSDDAGTVHQIDSIEGKLSRVAGSVAELRANLKGQEARDGLLFEGLVLGARRNGLILEAGECYDFKIAPVLGGAIHSDEIEKTSFVVKLNIAGQLHEQIRNLPPGTQIGEVTIS